MARQMADAQATFDNSGKFAETVAEGYVQASDIEPVIGALLTIGSVIWSVADKRGYADLREQVRARG